MTRKLLLAAALTAAVLPATAQAQSFQGPYVGVQAGWNHDIAIADDKDAFIAGVYGGYDYEIAPNIVLGAEGGFSLGASDRIGPNGTDLATIDPEYSFDLSARAGYVVGDNNLLYVRGGYANSRAKVTRTVGGAAFSDKQTFDGWFVGGGAERKITDNVSARLEYRFVDYDGDNSKYQRHQVLAGVAYRF